MQECEVKDTSYRQKTIMSDNVLVVYVDSPVPLTIAIGTYCTFKGEKYYVQKPSNVKENHSRSYEYTISMGTYQEYLKKWKIRHSDGRVKFSYTGKPEEILKLIVDNLNWRDAGWTAGTYSDGGCIEKDEIVETYNMTYIWDALKQLADDCDTEFEIIGKRITLKKVEHNKNNPIGLAYGLGMGIKPGTKRELSTGTDDIKIGSVYAQGGSTNIYKSAYGSTTLLLPKSQSILFDGDKFEDEAGFILNKASTYSSDENGFYVKRSSPVMDCNAEGALDASEIYPKRVGVISSVMEKDSANNFWDFYDAGIPEALNFKDFILSEEKMTVKFQTGMLAGRDREFEVAYTHALADGTAVRKFEIVPQEIDGITMPNETWCPVVGDKYIVLNVSLPNAYICDNATKTGASWDMMRQAVKYLAAREEDSFAYTVELDGIFTKKNWPIIESRMVLGGFITYTSGFEAGKLIRMTSIKEYINKPYSPTIELSNMVSSAGIGTEIGKIANAEVTQDETKREAIQFTKRQFRDAKETMGMLASALLENFTKGISPITVQAMQALVGDESLQFRFVDAKGTELFTPTQIGDGIVYNNDTKIMTFTSKWLQHMTLGISSLSSSHKAAEYKYWLIEEMNHPLTEDDAASSFYLYAVCSKTAETGHLMLSSTAIDMSARMGEKVGYNIEINKGINANAVSEERRLL